MEISIKKVLVKDFAINLSASVEAYPESTPISLHTIVKFTSPTNFFKTPNYLVLKSTVSIIAVSRGRWIVNQGPKNGGNSVKVLLDSMKIRKKALNQKLKLLSK